MGDRNKKSIGKLDLKEMTKELEQYCADAGIGILPIENRSFDTIQKLLVGRAD